MDYAKAHSGIGLVFPFSEAETIHLVAYSGASFAMSPNRSSHLGLFIVLADGEGNARILSFASRESKCVVRSVLWADIFAFGDAFDEALLLRHDVRAFLHRNARLRVLTDIPSLLSIIIRLRTTTERCLMIDLKSAREAFDSCEIAEIGWINREGNEQMR